MLSVVYKCKVQKPRSQLMNGLERANGLGKSKLINGLETTLLINGLERT